MFWSWDSSGFCWRTLYSESTHSRGPTYLQMHFILKLEIRRRCPGEQMLHAFTAVSPFSINVSHFFSPLKLKRITTAPEKKAQQADGSATLTDSPGAFQWPLFMDSWWSLYIHVLPAHTLRHIVRQRPTLTPETRSFYWPEFNLTFVISALSEGRKVAFIASTKHFSSGIVEKIKTKFDWGILDRHHVSKLCL